MGSDNDEGHRRFAFQRLLILQKRHAILLLGGIILFLSHSLPPPEVFYAETFVEYNEFVPERCLDTVTKFKRVQEHHEKLIVLVCHRKWCNSWGHCDPCMGLGDRMRFLLSAVELATKEGMAVQLDHTVHGMQVLESALYTDKSGWWGEVFRYRTWPGKERTVKQMAALSDTRGHVNFQRGAVPFDYDACYFYALFRPTPALETEIQRHDERIGQPSIGIHFRAGDVAAFGLERTRDVRSTGTLESSLLKMLTCADELAAQLFPSQQQNVTYYLATDSVAAKDWIQKRRQHSSHDVYTTTVQPQPYIRAVTSSEWLELFLLSKRQGLVANQLPKNYPGLVSYPYSMFAKMAKTIGFLPEDAFRLCDLS